jgi:hypothetical protein
MEVSGQLHDPAILPPGKQPLVSIVQEAGWAPEWKFEQLTHRDKVLFEKLKKIF